MRNYNRALDYMALAMREFAKGNKTTAAKLFVEASKSNDAGRAMEMIEATNSVAYASMIKAAAAKKKAKASKTQAKRKVKAAEDEFVESLDNLDDEGAEEAEEDEEEDEVEGAMEPEGDPEEVEDEAIEEEDNEEDAALAKLMASLERKTKKRK